MFLFATPDFGAGGMVCIIAFLMMAAVAVLVIGGVSWVFCNVKNAKGRAVFAVFLCIAAVFASYFYWQYKVKPYQDFERLLSGGQDVSIVRMEIIGQGKAVVMSDPNATSFLTERMRVGGRRGNEHGYSYIATIYLSSGSSVRGSIDIPEDKGFFNMYYPIDTLGEGTFYTFWLPDPIPESLAATFERLRK